MLYPSTACRVELPDGARSDFCRIANTSRADLDDCSGDDVRDGIVAIDQECNQGLVEGSVQYLDLTRLNLPAFEQSIDWHGPLPLPMWASTTCDQHRRCPGAER